MKNFRLLLLLVLSLSLSCAGVLSSFRSSSTKTVDKAPYYAGKTQELSGVIGHFPVEMDVRLYRDFFSKDRRHALSPLMDAMNEFLDGLEVSVPLVYIDKEPEHAPDVYVGGRYAGNSPITDVSDNDNHDDREMVVYQLAPSKAWKDSLLAISAAESIDYYIYVSIGFSDYFVRQKNLLGSKELSIGTGYNEDIPWMTDLDTPAEVLHVTGALMDRNGKILRCGAEGILAKRTGFWSSMFDMQDMIDEKEIKNIQYSVVRDDLQGSPLAWQVALNNLVAQLLGEEKMIIE